MADDDKPKRRRVPVSCLVCKKRKVKCDKGKPACGGCVRNGAAHLCEYIEPPWSKGMKPVEPAAAVVEKSSEYRQLQLSTQKIIAAQRAEIEELKRYRQATFATGSHPGTLLQGTLQGPHASPNVSPQGTPLTVLNKLRPLSAKSRDSFEVSTHHHNMVIPVNYKKYFVDMFSWMNVVKLDPKLTSMWLKLGGLQKLYHLYKMNRLKPVAFQRPSSQVAAPVPTAASHTVVKPEPLKCPVLETSEINLEDLSEVPSKRATPVPREMAANLTPVITDIESSITRVQMIIHNVWSSMIDLGTSKLSDKQLYFLLEFYFSNPTFVFESREVLQFYRQDLLSVIRIKSGTVSFDCMALMGAARDNAMLHQLHVKGTYVAILSMVVDASLQFLSTYHKTNPLDTVSHQYHEIFGDIPAKVTTDLSDLMGEFVGFYKKRGDAPILGFVAAMLAWVNREITSGIQVHHPGADYRSKVTGILTGFLQLLLREDAAIAIWKDPRMVQFAQTTSSVQSNDELRIHVFQLWLETVRSANLVNFRIMPLIAGSDTLDQLINKLHVKIEEADSCQCHENYIASQPGHHQELRLSLRFQYHISKMFYTINRGIVNLFPPQVTVELIKELVDQSYRLLEEIVAQQTARYSRQFEAISMISYTSLFLGYLIMIQAEELALAELLSRQVPELINRLCLLFGYLEQTISEVKGTLHSQYVLKAITEIVLRTIQLQLGLLIRNQSDGKKEGLVWEILQQPSNSVARVSQSILAVLRQLEDSEMDDRDKLTKMKKMWSFYETFSSNINYASLHKNLPEFNQQAQSNECPVMVKRSESAKDLVAGVADKFRKCPISHITTPVDDNPETPKISGVLEHQSLAAVKDELGVSRKRKCPFDHQTISGQGRYGYNPLESNIRGGGAPVKMEASPTSMAIPRQPTTLLPAPVAPPPIADANEFRPEFIDFGFDLDFDTLQMDVVSGMNLTLQEFDFEEPFEQSI